MAAKKGLPRVIRRICLWCQGNSWRLVRECAQDYCPLYPHRLDEHGDEALLVACIGEFCLSCAGGSEAVAECTADSTFNGQPPCPAHPYRLVESSVLAQQIRLLPGIGDVRTAVSDDVGVSGGQEATAETRPAVGDALSAQQPAAFRIVNMGREPEALDI